MYCKPHLILFFLFCFGKSFSQSNTDSLHLYFAVNEITSASHYKQLDSLYSALDGKNFTLKIYGYADFLNSNAFNIRLSQKRAEAVKNYLLKQTWNMPLKITECEGFGESYSKDNQSLLGDFKQRRVDVIVSQNIPKKVIETATDSKKNKAKDVKVIKPKEELSAKKNIEELQKGESFTLDGLSFEPGRHFILRSSVPVLEKLLLTLQQNEQMKIEIQGHVCCSSDEADGFDYDSKDRKLSEHRAKVIYDYLIKKGIDPGRLSYKGYGHSMPKIQIEMSQEDEQTNRRVDVKLLEN
jgi:outer membrane protein OmpA-like peptidoglycan-associated protein